LEEFNAEFVHSMMRLGCNEDQAEDLFRSQPFWFREVLWEKRDIFSRFDCNDSPFFYEPGSGLLKPDIYALGVYLNLVRAASNKFYELSSEFLSESFFKALETSCRKYSADPNGFYGSGFLES